MGFAGDGWAATSLTTGLSPMSPLAGGEVKLDIVMVQFS
jgi:hypothetical protein